MRRAVWARSNLLLNRQDAMRLPSLCRHRHCFYAVCDCGEHMVLGTWQRGAWIGPGWKSRCAHLAEHAAQRHVDDENGGGSAGGQVLKGMQVTCMCALFHAPHLSVISRDVRCSRHHPVGALSPAVRRGGSCHSKVQASADGQWPQAPSDAADLSLVQRDCHDSRSGHVGFQLCGLEQSVWLLHFLSTQ